MIVTPHQYAVKKMDKCLGPETLQEKIMQIRECHSVAFNEYVKLRRDGYLEACAAVGIDLNAQIEREGQCLEILRSALPKLGIDLEWMDRTLAAEAEAIMASRKEDKLK